MKRTIWHKLNDWKNKKYRKPLIIKGARQVGKTYILQEFGKSSFPDWHYFNFEDSKALSNIFEPDLDPKRIIRELSFYANKKINDQDLIIFDEIQNTPRAITSLKYFHEQLPQMAICSAGSLLGIQLSNEAFPVGKVEFLFLNPMSFEEFLFAQKDLKSLEYLEECKTTHRIPDLVHNHLWEKLKIYFIVGGLPEVVKTYIDNKENLFHSLQQARKLQNNLILTYLADIAKHSGKQNAMHLERLLMNIPAQLAKELNGSASKFVFKGIVPGLSRYSRLAGSIDWLISAGLTVKCHIVNKGQLPFSAYTKENSFKLFLFDVGLLGAISGLPPKVILNYDYGSYKGYFAENYIAQEFICSGVLNLNCWNEGRAEVEFLREIDGDVIPIEVKSGWITQAKSLRVFADKYQPKYRVIFSGKTLNIDKKNRIHHYPLYLANKFPL
ncbi:ATP-binding protein [Candidatus Margulisiibacteriota bacterium]